jgi:hypothetical protein
VACLGIAGIAEAEGIEQRDGAGAHGEDVAQDPAHPSSSPLERLDKGRVVVTLDLEDDGPAVPNVDRPRVLAGALQDGGAGLGQPAQEDSRMLVGAVLGPQGREQPQFCVGRPAPQARHDPLVLFDRQAELEGELGSDQRRKFGGDG